MCGSEEVKENSLPNSDNEDTSTLILHEKIRDLSRQVQEKDNEINILVSFIQKHNGARMPTTEPQGEIVKDVVCDTEQNISPSVTEGPAGTEGQSSGVAKSQSIKGEVPARLPLTQTNFNETEAFEIFQWSYPSKQAIHDNKALLREKYQEAKRISEHVNKARDEIDSLKSQIQKCRIERAMQGLHGGQNKDDVLMYDPLEDQLISQIEAEKKNYKDGFNMLRDLKREIEHLHHLLEQSHMKVKDDFQKWFSLLAKVEHTAASQAHPLLASHPPQDLQSKHGFLADDQSQQVHSARDHLHSHGRQQAMVCDGKDIHKRKFDDQDVACRNLEDATFKGLSTCQTTLCSNGQVASARSQISLHSERETVIPITGNAKADADIAAFYKARDTILKLRAKQATL